MDALSGIVGRHVLGNSLQEWLVALLCFAAIYTALRMARRVLVRRLRVTAKRTATRMDDVALAMLKSTRKVFVGAWSLYAASALVKLSPQSSAFVWKAAFLSALYQSAVWGKSGISSWVESTSTRNLTSDAAAATTLGLVGIVARFALYGLLSLLALNNLGVDITALVAGLGVGGIAIALAVQNILGDLFASLTIVLDKPFVVGDVIAVDDMVGTVERIGLKTTRIRSVSGEQLIFSNTDLLKSRIRNHKRMHERRAVFGIGLLYETPVEKLRRVPAMIREAIEAHPQARFERAHFKSFGDSDLKFEVVYWLKTPDYGAYMDIQQAVNLALLERFGVEGIEFAYPTQTQHVRHIAPAPVPEAARHRPAPPLHE